MATVPGGEDGAYFFCRDAKRWRLASSGIMTNDVIKLYIHYTEHVAMRDCRVCLLIEGLRSAELRRPDVWLSSQVES